VSWASFQEERWKIDEAAMVAAIEAAGNTYVSADAESSSAKQLTDIEALITQGVDALVINAWDKDAIAPAIEAAANEGIPVIGYDRLIEDDRTFYLTFDNIGVGRIIATIIKGDPGDPNAMFLLQGMMEVIGSDVDAGKIKIVGESFSDGWKPENAQKNMEQILTGRAFRTGSCDPSGRSRWRLGSDQPRCTWHADCVRLERCSRSGQSGR